MDLPKLLSEQCISKEEAHSLLIAIEEQVNSRLFTPSGSVSQPSILSPLSADFLAEFQTDNSEEKFRQVREWLKSVPALTLYVPFALPKEELSKFLQEVRLTAGSNDIFLEVKIDPGLVAGCAFAWRGVYRDYSLRSTPLTDFVKKNLFPDNAQ